MLRLTCGSKLLWHSLLAGGAVLVAAAPAWACSEHAGPMDLDRCWSGTRLLAWGLSLVVWWGVCFHLVFPALLQPQKSTAPWPRTAFGRCLALWWCLLGLSFLVIFALLSDELRRPGWRWMPAGWFGSFINLHWEWLGVTVLTVAGAGLILWRVQHHQRRAA